MVGGWRNLRRTERDRFAELLAARETPDVVEAALWLAAEEYPGLDLAAERRRLEQLSREGARRARADNPFERLDALREYLFEELGFAGNTQNYDDPRNSYLNEVLDRRLGIPITLSIVFLSVARAAGFTGRGVSLPGHFICFLELEGRRILVDPFHGGQVVTEEDCRDLVARSTGRPDLFDRRHLEGASERTVLARLLHNLKHVYLGVSDYSRALTVVQRLLQVRPGDPNEVRDGGLLKAHLGRPGAAIADLETYLQMAPVAPDAESVKGRVVWLRRKLSETN